MNTENSKRETSGRFAKGSVGRPKRAKNKRKSFSPAELAAIAAETANAKLDGLFGQSVDVIEQQLSQGSLKAAMWSVDRILPTERNRLSQAISAVDMTFLEGIVQNCTNYRSDGR